MHQANLIDSALQCAVFDTNYSCTAIKKLSSGQLLVVRSCRFWNASIAASHPVAVAAGKKRSMMASNTYQY
jgi:hypothetical protein